MIALRVAPPNLVRGFGDFPQPSDFVDEGDSDTACCDQCGESVAEVRCGMKDRWPQEFRFPDEGIRSLDRVSVQWRGIEIRARQMNVLNTVELGHMANLLWFRPVCCRIPWVPGPSDNCDVDAGLGQASDNPASPGRIAI